MYSILVVLLQRYRPSSEISLLIALCKRQGFREYCIKRQQVRHSNGRHGTPASSLGLDRKPEAVKFPVNVLFRRRCYFRKHEATPGLAKSTFWISSRANGAAAHQFGDVHPPGIARTCTSGGEPAISRAPFGRRGRVDNQHCELNFAPPQRRMPPPWYPPEPKKQIFERTETLAEVQSDLHQVNEERQWSATSS